MNYLNLKSFHLLIDQKNYNISFYLKYYFYIDYLCYQHLYQGNDNDKKFFDFLCNDIHSSQNTNHC